MIEVHDPVRLLMIVEHFPEVVLKTIQRLPETYEWFKNEWVKLVAMHPETKMLFVFQEGLFEAYAPMNEGVHMTSDIEQLIEANHDNLPVYTLLPN